MPLSIAFWIIDGHKSKTQVRLDIISNPWHVRGAKKVQKPLNRRRDPVAHALLKI